MCLILTLMCVGVTNLEHTYTKYVTSTQWNFKDLTKETNWKYWSCEILRKIGTHASLLAYIVKWQNDKYYTVLTVLKYPLFKNVAYKRQSWVIWCIKKTNARYFVLNIICKITRMYKDAYRNHLKLLQCFLYKQILFIR